jgi:hypothetical protein
MNSKEQPMPVRRLVFAMLLCLPLTACLQTGSAGTKGATFCQAAKVIYWSSKDTRTTQDQATEHNSVGKELCGWGKAR